MISKQRRFDREWDAFGWGFGPWGPWMGTRRRGKWFEAGEMRYVILELLKDKPKHGYELMKDLEEQSHGCYQPSPGTVYPTLQWLEDEALVQVQEADGKKVYQITDAGRAFLEQHRDRIDDIFDRVRKTVERVMGGANPDVHKAVGRLVATVYRASWKARSDDVRRQVAARVNRTTDEIEEMLESA